MSKCCAPSVADNGSPVASSNLSSKNKNGHGLLSSSGSDEKLEYPEELMRLLESQYIRFGDRIKLLTRSQYVKAKLRQENLGRKISMMDNNEMYVGIYEKPDACRRVAVPPVGETAPGSIYEITLRLVNPKHRESKEIVVYGDLVQFLMEQKNSRRPAAVWSHLNSKGQSDGYITPVDDLDTANNTKSNGALTFSFCKNGKFDEPLVYGEPGVTIQIEDGPFVGNKLTNFKYSNSKVLGGYVCLNGNGQELYSVIHREGSPETPQFQHALRVPQILPVLDDQVEAFETEAKGREEVAENWKELSQTYDASFEDAKRKDQRRLYIALGKMIGAYIWTILALPLASLYANLFYAFLMQRIALIVLESNDLNATCANAAEKFEVGVLNAIEINMKFVLLAALLTYAFGLFTPKFLYAHIHPSSKKERKSLVYLPHGNKENKIEDTVSSTLPSLPLEETDFNSGLQGEAKGDKGSYTLPKLDTRSWRSDGVDKSGIPKHPAFQRFLIGEFNNMKKALARWEVTCDWRESKQIDGMLLRSHPLFKFIKDCYPHAFIGRSKGGYPIYIERPGDIKIKEVLAAKVSVDDLLYHYVYITEFAWKVLEPEGSPKAKFVTIFDLTNVKFKDFFGDAVTFLKSAVSISSTHYPETSYKIFVLNIPRWFSVVFKIIKPFMAEETLKKIRIFRHGYEKELLEEIDADILPQRYGGNFKGGDFDYEMEKELWKHCFKVNVNAGEPMLNDHSVPDPSTIQKMKDFIEKEMRF